ncbi:MAG: hypothetical protein HY905_23440 [Deltaproteobacteria bacterium]|nr:hypothetical protein [Deltaproteobacteria bacterium]
MDEKQQDVEKLARTMLADVVPELVLEPSSGQGSRRTRGPDPDAGPDLIGRLGRQRVVVEIKTMTAVRVEDLRGHLAVAVLRLRRSADRPRAIPLVVVVAPAAGPKAWAAAEAFMADNAPDVGWAIFDRLGSARVAVPAAGIDVRRRAGRDPGAKRERQSVRLFSDLNCWMLKILLLPEAPDGLWGGPRQVVHSPTELGRVAGVSVEMAHRLARTLEARDLLRRDRIGLHPVRPRALLDLWRTEAALGGRPPVPVRWIMARPAKLGAGLQDDPGLVVAGFEACRQLGMLHAAAEATEMHVLEPFERVLGRRRLERCAPHEADLWLLRCATPTSVFRGSVVRRGLRVADVLQAALDVAHHPDRGPEQFEYIVERVLRLGGDR